MSNSIIWVTTNKTRIENIWRTCKYFLPEIINITNKKLLLALCYIYQFFGFIPIIRGRFCRHILGQQHKVSSQLIAQLASIYQRRQQKSCNKHECVANLCRCRHLRNYSRRRPRYRSSWPHSLCFPPVADVLSHLSSAATLFHLFEANNLDRSSSFYANMMADTSKGCSSGKGPRIWLHFKGTIFSVFSILAALCHCQNRCQKKNFHLCCRKLIESDHSRSCRVKWLSKGV